LHPAGLAPHAKKDDCGIGVYKFGQEFFIIGIFLEIFVQILKNNSG
jgi:hypothetical protein